jgi:hypothetical protein
MITDIDITVSLGLVIRPSQIHGNGIFASAPIEANNIFYSSENITVSDHSIAGSVEKTKHEHWLECSIIRWINHSCKPNAEVLFSEDEIFLNSLRHINAGEEITCNYYKTESKITFSFVCNCSHCANRKIE